MTAPVPKPYIMAIAPYIPGRSTTDDGRKVAKLSSNENPLGTSPLARAAFESAAHRLERYPDASGTDLRDALAEKHGLDPARIIYGNGSDEVLHLAAGAFAGAGDEVIFVHYGFAVYEIAARRVGAVPVIAPDSDYATDVDAILACVTERTRIVYIANPNNPTGTYVDARGGGRAGWHDGLRAARAAGASIAAYAEYIAGDQPTTMTAIDLRPRARPTSSSPAPSRRFTGLPPSLRLGWCYALGRDHRGDAIAYPSAPSTINDRRACAAGARRRSWTSRTSMPRIPATTTRQWREILTRRDPPSSASRACVTVPSAGEFRAGADPGLSLSDCRRQAKSQRTRFLTEQAYKGLMDAGYMVGCLQAASRCLTALRITVGDRSRDRAGDRSGFGAFAKVEAVEDASFVAVRAKSLLWSPLRLRRDQDCPCLTRSGRTLFRNARSFPRDRDHRPRPHRCLAVPVLPASSDVDRARWSAHDAEPVSARHRRPARDRARRQLRRYGRSKPSRAPALSSSASPVGAMGAVAARHRGRTLHRRRHRLRCR